MILVFFNYENKSFKYERPIVYLTPGLRLAFLTIIRKRILNEFY